MPNVKQTKALNEVVASLTKIPDLAALLGNAIRLAIDSVIDGPRTGRWSIGELEKTEKAYIGTRVEILVRTAIGASRGKLLDYEIAGHEVDAKFSIKFGGWMIPQEAVDQLCLLIAADDNKHQFWVGVVFTEEAILRPGINQDKKSSILAEGRTNILWLANGAPLPRNFLAELPKPDRDAVFAKKTGPERVIELFRKCPGQAIPGEAIVSVGSEFDSAWSRIQLAADGLREYEILSGDDDQSRAIAFQHKITLPPGYYACIPKPKT